MAGSPLARCMGLLYGPLKPQVQPGCPKTTRHWPAKWTKAVDDKASTILMCSAGNEKGTAIAVPFARIVDRLQISTCTRRLLQETLVVLRPEP